jgi:biotin carboxylase
MKRRLMMIGGWTSLYEKAKACDFDLTVLQRKVDLKPDDWRVADHLISSDMDAPMVADVIAAIHAHHPFDAIVSFQELGVMNAALAQDRLGILGNPLRPVMLTRNKLQMRDHLRNCGVPSIPYRAASSTVEVTDFASEHGLPIILKPAAGSGSQNIHKISSLSEIPAALQDIASGYWKQGALVEKFIEGPEVSVEAVSWNGEHVIIAITDKITSGAPYFVELGHTMPSNLPLDTALAISNMTRQFLDSIGHRHGPSHTEIIVGESGPVIVESHTRTGGDQIFEMVDYAFGVDMFTFTLKGLAGAQELAQPKPATGAAIRYVSLPPGRTISSALGLDEVRSSTGVVQCEFTLKPGDFVPQITNSDDRYGYVLCIGATRDEAVSNAEVALKKLKVVFESLS